MRKTTILTLLCAASISAHAACAMVSNAYGRTARQQAECDADFAAKMAEPKRAGPQTQLPMDTQLYWKIEDRAGTITVIVPSRYEVYDTDADARPTRYLTGVETLSSSKLFVVAESKTFSADKLLPLDDFKSVIITATSPTRLSDGTVLNGSWVANVETKSGGKTQDRGFRRDTSFTYQETPDNSGKPLQALVGKAYIYNPGNQRFDRRNMRYPLMLRDVYGAKLSLLTEADANEFITKVDAMAENATKVEAEAKQNAAAAYDELVNRFKMAKLGSEDSCEGILEQSASLSDKQKVTCQLTAKEPIELGSIKQSGWLVTNVSQMGTGRQQKIILMIKKAVMPADLATAEASKTEQGRKASAKR